MKELKKYLNKRGCLKKKFQALLFSIFLIIVSKNTNPQYLTIIKVKY